MSGLVHFPKKTFNGIFRKFGFTVLALAFLGVGLFFILGLLQNARDASALRDSVIIPAHVKNVRVVTRPGARGSGGSSSVEAEYEFNWDGRIYKSNRLYLWEEPAHSYLTLRAAEVNGTTVPCYVVPSNPNLSVLNKDFSLGPAALGALFGLVFSGVGIMLIIGSIRDLLSHVVTK